MRHRPTPSGPRAGGSPFGALLLVLAMAMMAVVYIMMAKGQQTGSGPAPSPAEPVDPFAGMSYTEDDVGRGPSDGADAKSAAEVDALLSSVAFEDEVDNWDRARDLQAEAKQLMVTFQGLRDDGDAGWRDPAREARAKYEDALLRGDVYRDALAESIGEEAYEVQRLDKLLQAWRRDVMGLRKTVGD